jgi:Flp pilus assembly protein TadG
MAIVIESSSARAGKDRSAKALQADEQGAALLEFALVLPVLLMILLGILGYGGYFWRANVLQQVANDAARASMPGITAAERTTLARNSVAAEIAQMGGIQASRVTTTVQENGATLSVRLSYNGSADPFLRLSVVPLPSTTIQRTAVVRMGGF